ncbi:MAG TPA: proline dehydrogenase family protein [Fimbriimonas sp.]|nr:proline dehydrogenase family protein [Fimbriimonas sp.]
MSLARTIILKTATLKPVESMVRKTFLFKPLVTRFIAGDTLEESIVESEKILDTGLRITLDYLGENTHSEAEALAARATYLDMLQTIDAVRTVQSWKANPTSPEPLNISIKLTQCGLDQGSDFAEKNYRDVVERAAQLNNFVRIDMEASEYTARTVDIVSRVHKEFKNTGTVLQSYLHRNDDDVDFMIENKIRTRLVKGAYLEPEAVAYQSKAKVDEQYVAQAKRLLLKGTYPAIATQDEKIIQELKAFVQENAVDKAGFEFQMLLGIRRDLQNSLRDEGFNVRVYVPFGDQWYPYFTRRLAERPANALFMLKNLFKK